MNVQLTMPLWDRTVKEILEGEKPLDDFYEDTRVEVDSLIGLHNELIVKAGKDIASTTPELVPT